MKNSSRRSYDDPKSYQKRDGWSLVGVGGAVLVLGLSLIVTYRRDDEERAAAAPPSATEHHEL